MTTPNQCQFWDCDETIRQGYTLCLEHHRKRDTINQCPSCMKYKDARYEVCGKCYRQPAAAPRVSAPDVAPSTGSTDAALLEELRALRRNLARTHRRQEFTVFSNDTLEQLAVVRPTTEEAMLAVKGIGESKMAQFGEDVLRVIRAHSNQPQTPVQPPGARANRQTDAAANRPQAPEQAAEPQTDDPRKRWPADIRTDDGHYVRSRGEAMVDNWLYNHHIAHAYERKLPGIPEDVISDFYLPQGGRVYIEVWGMEKIAAYAHRMREKQEIYGRYKFPLIELKDAELNNLDDHMPRFLRYFGISVA